MSVTIVVPTIGRPTLLRALAALAPQLGPADQVVVVADPVGNVGMARGAYDEVASDDRWTWLVLDKPGDDHGYAARTLGMAHATGTHIGFADDDDQSTPTALEAMRAHACDVPVFLQMRYGTGDDGVGYILWHQKILRYGMVGSPMILVPNEPRKFGVWRDHAGVGSAGGDYQFAVGCVAEMGQPRWVEHIVCHVRPPVSS